MSKEQNKTSLEAQSDTRQQLNDAYDLAKEAASDAVDAAKYKSSSEVENAKLKATEFADKTESYIKEKPLVSIGAAFVAGWAISKLLK